MLKFTLNLASRIRSKRPIVLPNIATTKAQADTLALIYLRVVKAWEQGTARIVASYEHSLSQMVTDAPNDTAGIISEINAELQRLVLLLTPDLREWAFRTERWHAGRWVRNVLSATSVDLSTILSPSDVRDTVDASIQWNVALVRDVSEQTRQRISNAVFAGFQRRAPAREIAKEIRQATGLARKRSLNIAADQSSKLGAKLNEARQQQAGLEHFKWRHSGKQHPRAWHKARDGKVYRWDDPEIAQDKPGVAPYCGCTGQGVIIPEESATE